MSGCRGTLSRRRRPPAGSSCTITVASTRPLPTDSGYEAPAVYAWARRAGFQQMAPVKGVEGFNRASPVTGPTYVDVTAAGKRLRRGARLWTVAVSSFKAETYRFLRLERPSREETAEGALPPAGTIHLPDWAESEWLKQLVGEQLVTVRSKRGFAKLEWQKLRERNEAVFVRLRRTSKIHFRKPPRRRMPDRKPKVNALRATVRPTVGHVFAHPHELLHQHDRYQARADRSRTSKPSLKHAPLRLAGRKAGSNMTLNASTPQQTPPQPPIKPYNSDRCALIVRLEDTDAGLQRL